MDYKNMSNVLEVRDFHVCGKKATASLFLYSNKEVEQIGSIIAEKFDEPVCEVKVSSRFGNFDLIVDREWCWAAIIAAVQKIPMVQFESVTFGDSLVPHFAMQHEHLSYLLTDKEVEALGNIPDEEDKSLISSLWNNPETIVHII